MEDVLLLRRDDHAIFAKETFSALLKSGDCADVTLVDEDNIQSIAHKVILSAGSDFFTIMTSSSFPSGKIPKSVPISIKSFISASDTIQLPS